MQKKLFGGVLVANIENLLLAGENLQLHRMVFQRTMVLTMLP
jgi:hypothetical protein